MADYKTKKNGLIETMRFLCSVWVAYFHGFFPISSDKFNGVILPVDFFFLVSGFFFLKSIQKYRSRRVGEGVRFVIWSRINRFIVPLIIAALSILLCNVIFEIDAGFNWPLSFLWFFAAQFVYLTFFYLLFKFIKKKLFFNIACVLITFASMSLFLIGFEVLDICFRGPAMIAIGILVSQIPKINIRLKKREAAKSLNLAVNVVGFLVSFLVALYLIYRPEHAVWKIHLICGILFPAIVYFATSIPIKGRIFDLLGEFSIFIYIAQCPILLHYYAVTHDTNKEFYTLLVCAVLLFLVNRAVDAIKKRRRAIRA